MRVYGAHYLDYFSQKRWKLAHNKASAAMQLACKEGVQSENPKVAHASGARLETHEDTLPGKRLGWGQVLEELTSSMLDMLELCRLS